MTTLTETPKIAAIAILVCLMVAGAALLIIGNPSIPTEEDDVSFNLFEQGFYCGISERSEYMITDLDTWATVWLDMKSINYPTPPVPGQDFENQIIFAVFQGERATGGYITNITRVALTESGYIVYVDELHPGENCGTTQALTQPYHIVSINSTLHSLPVSFVYNVTVYSCPI